jgi:hypothetical protein
LAVDKLKFGCARSISTITAFQGIIEMNGISTPAIWSTIAIPYARNQNDCFGAGTVVACRRVAALAQHQRHRSALFDFSGPRIIFGATSVSEVQYCVRWRIPSGIAWTE